MGFECLAGGGHGGRRIDETMWEDLSFFIISLLMTGAPQQPLMPVGEPSVIANS